MLCPANTSVVRASFKGTAGCELSARLDLPPGPARAFAVFAHCFTCTKDVLAARGIASGLAAAGVGVLRFDFTGLGSSEGEFANTSFSSNVEDLVSAAAYLRDNFAAPTILIGHSLGGAAVLAAAGDIPEARAVVTIGAPADVGHVLKYFGSSLEEIRDQGEAWVRLAGRRFLIRRSFIADAEEHRLSERIGSLGKALLVMHAPRDAVVGIENAAKIFMAAKHPKSFVSLDDADHLLSDHAASAYAARVIDAWVSKYIPEAPTARERQTTDVLSRETQPALRTSSCSSREPPASTAGAFSQCPAQDVKPSKISPRPERQERSMTAEAAIVAAKPAKQPKPLPAPNSDFYEIYETLDAEEFAKVKRLRVFLEAKVAPVITKYWVDDAFPFDLLPAVKELGIGGSGMQGYGCAGGSSKLLGFIAMEMARVDPSFCTFFCVHDGLAMGSIYIDGSEEQKQKWLPPMARLEKIGCFGLTEPLVGSGASGGLTTTAKREGDTWILNGEKRWIGNAPWCDISVIWARDLADNQVKGFIIENKTTPGFSVEKIQNKISLKVVQNGHITLKDVRVSEANRLRGGNSFRDTARVLKMTRYLVAWMATGCAMGAYEAALKYCQERLQFGRPIGSFQLVQDLLAKMIANITASQCLIARQAQLHAEGKLTDAHAALAKAFATAKCRETVAWAREVLGGNGIVADYEVARFFTDAEALYSYEGTYQMQNLIVGKAVTGLSAFV